MNAPPKAKNEKRPRLGRGLVLLACTVFTWDDGCCNWLKGLEAGLRELSRTGAWELNLLGYLACMPGLKGDFVHLDACDGLAHVKRV